MNRAVLLSAAALLLAGCQTPPVAHPPASEVQMDSASSVWFKNLSYVVRPMENGLFQGQAQIQNLDSNAHPLRYRSEWYSEAGELLGESNWEMRVAQPGETLLITVVAHDLSATKIKMYLK